MAGTGVRPGRGHRGPARDRGRRARRSPWSAACATDDPFIDPRLFRSVPFSSATLVSLLTGYGFATAIIGAAVFVDRVLYGGPDEQRLALGALAGATAVGALVSGLHRPVRAAPLVAVGGLRAEHRRAGRDVVVDAEITTSDGRPLAGARSASGSG